MAPAGSRETALVVYASQKLAEYVVGELRGSVAAELLVVEIDLRNSEFDWQAKPTG